MADKDSTSPPCTIHTVYKPLLVFLRISGMYCPFILNRRRGFQRRITFREVLNCLISVLQFLYLAFITVFASSKILETTKLSASLMSRLSHATLSYGTLYSFVTIWIFGGKHLEGFLEKFHRYHQTFGSHKYLPRFARFVKRVTIVLYTSCFLFPLLTAVYILCYRDVMVLATNMSLPVFMKGPLNSIGMLTYIMGSMVVFSIVLMAVIGLHTVTSVFLALEFKSVTKSLKKALHKLPSKESRLLNSDFEPTDLETYILGSSAVSVKRSVQESCDLTHDSLYDIIEHHRRQHDALCRLLAKANHILCHIMFVVYATAIPLLCFVMYGMIAGSLPLKDFTLMLFEFCLEVFALILVTAMGIFLYHSIHEPIHHIYSVSYKDLSPNTLSLLSLFTNRLLSQPLGYSVYGLFVIQPSTVLTIGGTLATYAVVVLQLAPVSELFPVFNETRNARISI